MKQCKKCGAIQKNQNRVCIDCGEQLGTPLSKEEEANLNNKISKKIEKLSNSGDFFYVSRVDKIVGIMLIIGALTALLFKIIGGTGLGEHAAFLILVIIFMSLEAIDILFPHFMWELYKLKFIFAISNVDDMQPSDLQIYLRRIIAYLVSFVGYIYLIYVFVLLLRG